MFEQISHQGGNFSVEAGCAVLVGSDTIGNLCMCFLAGQNNQLSLRLLKLINEIASSSALDAPTRHAALTKLLAYSVQLSQDSQQKKQEQKCLSRWSVKRCCSKQLPRSVRCAPRPCRIHSSLASCPCCALRSSATRAARRISMTTFPSRISMMTFPSRISMMTFALRRTMPCIAFLRQVVKKTLQTLPLAPPSTPCSGNLLAVIVQVNSSSMSTGESFTEHVQLLRDATLVGRYKNCTMCSSATSLAATSERCSASCVITTT